MGLFRASVWVCQAHVWEGVLGATLLGETRPCSAPAPPASPLPSPGSLLGRVERSREGSPSAARRGGGWGVWGGGARGEWG